MTSILTPEPQRKTRTDLLAKLARRMLDPAATDGEAINAAEKFARIARIDGISFDDLGGILSLDRTSSARRPDACDVLMPHGRYAGYSLADIGIDDLPYLTWVSREFRSPELRDAARVVLDWITTGGDE